MTKPDLRFEYWGYPRNGSSKFYGVFLKDENATKLGEVKWASRKQRYVFIAVPETQLDADYLDTIQAFLKSLMYERKELRRRKRASLISDLEGDANSSGI
jgi:hypothetical protein